jgi:hypothetical protein
MSAAGQIELGPPGLAAELRLSSRNVAIGSNTHYQNWFNCLRSRSLPSAHEEIGHRSASLGQVVAMAYALGRSLQWDPDREQFEGDESANRLRRRALREPWRC